MGLACSWYLAAVATLTFALIFLVYLSFPQYMGTPRGTTYQVYRALPANIDDNTLGVTIGKGDARALIIDNYLKSRKSPLYGLGETFVATADRYGLDYRLLPAIAMQESNGGKILPHESYNPFGYGIYGGKVMRFDSFESAIERVAQGLKKDYIDQGLQTPEEIMPKYTPPSLQKGGAWAIGVSSFMEELM